MNKKLSIAYVSPGWPLNSYPNGIVAYIENLILGFENKITPYILAQKTNKQATDERVIDLSTFDVERTLIDKLCQTINIGYVQKLHYDRRYLRSSNKILNGLNCLTPPPDLLEIEESFGIVKWLVASSHLPIVTRLHGPWFIHGPIMKLENAPEYQHRVACEGLAIRASHGVSSPSLDVLNRVREFYGLELPNADVIPNPILAVPDEWQWRGVKTNSQTLLFVGRFDLHKGGDLVIDTFRMLAESNRDIKLIFAGKDRGIILNNKTILLREYISTFIHEQHIKDRIEFLGQCDAKQIAQLRRDSLITIVASRYENFGMSLLEALSAGCPVVATAIGGNKEIITDGSNGILAEAGSAESLCEKVSMLIDKPDLMLNLSKNAIEGCKAKYSPSIVAEQTLAFYQTILNK
jgi:glycosyltransferase involved in cell wall biosynthesis